MLRTAILWSSALFACSSGSGGLGPVNDDDGGGDDNAVVPPDTDTDLPPTTDTDDTGETTVPGAELTEARCEPHPKNALLSVCTFELSDPAGIAVTLHEVDAAFDLNTWERPAEASHTVVLWGMKQLSDYTWSVTVEASDATAGGSFTTGPLPSRMDIDFSVDGSAQATVQTLLVPYSCDGDGVMVIADGRGNVRWYVDLVEAAGLSGPRMISGFTWTSDQTLLAIVDREHVVEVNLAGETLLAWDRQAGDYDGLLHHDLFVWRDWIYGINARLYQVQGDDYVIDGVSVHDRTGAIVNEWTSFGMFDPVGDNVPWNADYWAPYFGNAVDSTHGNSLVVYDDGTMLVSLRHLDAALKVEADPTSEDFGTVHWAIGGRPSPLPTDFQITSSVPGAEPEWEVQHHPNFTENGNLVLFDNKENLFGNTRAIELELDEVDGIADIVAEYPVGQWCAFHGSVYELPSGNLLVTCATSRHAQEFDRQTQEVVWDMRGNCSPLGVLRYTMRMTPVSLY